MCVTPNPCAVLCNSQCPLETHTAQMWLRSENNISMIIFRYALSRGECVVTCIPSLHCVEQAASSLLTPATSTTHRRHPPQLVSPSRWHSVGTSIPFSRATSRMVWPARQLTSLSLICRVSEVGAVDTATGFIHAPPGRCCEQRPRSDRGIR